MRKHGWWQAGVLLGLTLFAGATFGKSAIRAWLHGSEDRQIDTVRVTAEASDSSDRAGPVVCDLDNSLQEATEALRQISLLETDASALAQVSAAGDDPFAPPPELQQECSVHAFCPILTRFFALPGAGAAFSPIPLLGWLCHWERLFTSWTTAEAGMDPIAGAASCAAAQEDPCDEECPAECPARKCPHCQQTGTSDRCVRQAVAGVQAKSDGKLTVTVSTADGCRLTIEIETGHADTVRPAAARQDDGPRMDVIHVKVDRDGGVTVIRPNPVGTPMVPPGADERPPIIFPLPIPDFSPLQDREPATPEKLPDCEKCPPVREGVSKTEPNRR
ncbi:MAG: hypothetical protein C4297_07555 [Gemmataceae bacterium]